MSTAQLTPGTTAQQQPQRRVGEIKNIGGRSYRLNENHRWERTDKEQAGGESSGQTGFDPSSISPEQRAAYAWKAIDQVEHQPLKRLLKALHGNDTYQDRGEIATRNVKAKDAAKLYDWMRQNVGKEVSGGKVVDLGEGRIGFASGAGAVAMWGAGDDGRHLVSYTTNTDVVAHEAAGRKWEFAKEPQPEESDDWATDDTVTEDGSGLMSKRDTELEEQTPEPVAEAPAEPEPEPEPPPVAKQPPLSSEALKKAESAAFANTGAKAEKLTSTPEERRAQRIAAIEGRFQEKHGKSIAEHIQSQSQASQGTAEPASPANLPTHSKEFSESVADKREAPAASPPPPAAQTEPAKQGFNQQTTRDFKAGMNSGTIQFEDTAHRDLYDIGAKGSIRSGGRNPKKQDFAGRNALVQKLKQDDRYKGMSDQEVMTHAADVYRESKAQMKGMKNGETRKVRRPHGNSQPQAPAESPKPFANMNLTSSPKAQPKPKVPKAKPAAKKPVQHRATEHKERASGLGIDLHDYMQIGNELFKEKYSQWETRNKARKEASKLTGLNRGDIARFNNKGLDHTSNHQRLKNLDVWGQELASQFPDLGWAGSEDYGAKLWELLEQDIEPQPRRNSDSFLNELDNFLLAEQARSDRSGQSFTDDDLSSVPFSRQGIVVRYRRWLRNHC